MRRTSAREPGKIVATLRISDPATLEAVARRDLTSVSIGYRVTQWKESNQ